MMIYKQLCVECGGWIHHNGTTVLVACANPTPEKQYCGRIQPATTAERHQNRSSVGH